MKPDVLISDYFTFKKDTFTVSYNGKAIVDLKTEKFVSINITLVNDFGSNSYM